MKKILFALLFSMIGLFAFAQRGEQVEGIKIAFLASKLNLDTKIAERFWPVYNQYDDEMRALIREKKNAKHDENASVEDILETEQKALDLKKKYSSQFLKIISNEQLSNLFQAEKEFRKMILRRAGRDK
jgi:hypothetical protein